MSQQINLFDPSFHKKKKYFSVRAMLQALFLIAIGSGIFYGYAKHQVNLMLSQFEETKKRYAYEQLRLANYSNDFSAKQSGESLQADLQKLDAEALAQKVILDTLKTEVTGNTVGYSEYMRAFARQTQSGLWLTGFDIEGDGTQISLKGATLSPQLVPVYIQRLSKEKVMHGKNFSSLLMQQPKAIANQTALKSYLEFSMQSADAHGGAK
jgi:hypothetical protein